MQYLYNQNIKMRALEPEDLEILYKWENDSSLWTVGNTLAPYSKYILREYISESHRDIFDIKQLRLIIEDKKSRQSIGLIDLFDFDPHHKRAAVGILISPDYQRKGFGTQTLNLLKEYAFSFLKLHQLYAHIPERNKASIQLFQKIGFQKAGTLKDWLQTSDGFADVIIMQLFNTHRNN